MKYPWFRLWNDLIASDKVQMLSGDDFKAWINLLVLANRGEPRGFLPAVNRVAFNLRCSAAEAGAILDRLKDAGLIDVIDGQMKPHDWDHWQPDRDGQSTARVREWREKKRASKAAETSTQHGCNTDEALHETFQPLHETQVKRFTSVSSFLTNNTSMDVKEDKKIQSGNVSCNASETFHVTPTDNPPPTYPDTQTTMHHIDTGPHAIEDATARDIWRRIWVTWKDESLCIGWYRWQSQYTAEVWTSAFSQTKEQYPEQKINIGLVAKIAANIAANGRKGAKPFAADAATPSRPKTEKQIWREKNRKAMEDFKAKHPNYKASEDDEEPKPGDW